MPRSAASRTSSGTTMSDSQKPCSRYDAISAAVGAGPCCALGMVLVMAAIFDPPATRGVPEVAQNVSYLRTMSVVRPPGLRAGFHANASPGDPSGLVHAGEHWAPGTFAIDRHVDAGWELYLQAHGTTTWRIAGA